jgi:3-hydroxy acid dehydrogenase / malonic semialdehyde reductase
MVDIKGQTAFITGASSGIGKACAEYFARLGVNVILTARRMERLEETAKMLSSQYKIEAFPMQMDVQNRAQVESVFNQQNQEIDILVNNAGLALATDKIQDGDPKNWDVMIDTNIKGLLYVTRCALPRMINRDKGHIINIGSVAGKGHYISGNVYSATKHAVNAITHSLRLDLMGTAIRISEIDPGLVETEFSEVRWKDKERAKKFYQGFHPLSADDIADAVLYCATRPLHVNITEMHVYPQAQAGLSQVHREGDKDENLLTALFKK